MRLNQEGVQGRPTAPIALVAGLVSGVLTSLAFPPTDWGFVAFIGLVPLAMVFRRARALQLAAASLVFGLSFFGLVLYWIRMFGPEAYVGLVVSQTLWVMAALHVGRVGMERLKGGWRVAAFPLAFLAGEYLRAKLPLGGFTWGGLGYSQHDNLSILRLAAYTGVWGVSLLVAGVNALLGEAVLRLRPAPLRSLGLAALALLAGAAPAILPGAPDADGARARIAMIQGNAPEGTTDPHSDDLTVLTNHVSLTRSLEGPDPSLVVWPESALEGDLFSDPSFGRPLVDTIRDARVPFLVGATIDAPGGGFRNSSLFFRSDGTLAGRYDKQHLVPFGEYVPARRLLEPLVAELRRVPDDGIPGHTSTVFTIPEGTFASVICYESTFPELVRSFIDRGARFLVVSTNNSSYGRSPASEQHLAFSQLRAAEHGIWVAHTALTGISAVVSPDGRVVARTPLFEPAVLVPEIQFATRLTPYGRYGDWLPVATLCLLLVIILLPLWRRLAMRRPPAKPDFASRGGRQGPRSHLASERAADGG